MTTSIENTYTTLLQLLKEGETYLREAGLNSPRKEADLLVCHAARISRLQLYMGLQNRVPLETCQRARGLFAQRAARIPFQYLVGNQEFWGLDLEIKPGVFIPRPETEVLVGEAIAWTTACREDQKITIVDLGTGSGCIGIAMARACTKAQIWAIDISDKALKIAEQNARRLGVAERIAFLKGNLFEPLKGRVDRVDMILSNPPYVRSGDLKSLSREIRDHEPWEALDGGEDGLDVCRRIVQRAVDYLVPDGILLLEIGDQQAGPLKGWVKQQGLPWEVDFRHDLSGIQRVALLKKKWP